MLVGLVAVFAGFTSASMILFQRAVPDITWRPASGYLVRFKSLNVVACSTTCSRLANCTSIFYTPADGDCQLHHTAIDVSKYSNAKEVTLSSAAYVKSNATSSYAFEHDTQMSGWTLANVSANDTFYYRILSMNNYTQADAENVCGSQNSHLPRIKTLERLEFYRTTIIRTVSLNYWTEGKNTYSGDWIWRWSDGTPIPLTQGPSGFWGPLRPNNGNKPLCLRMRADMEYLLDDDPCTTLHPTICERDL